MRGPERAFTDGAPERSYGDGVARDRRDDEFEQLAAEVDQVRPYLDLAREIRDAVSAFTEDDDAQVDSLVVALDAIPSQHRAATARAVFERLPAERQWAVLERLYGDDELRDHLAGERERRLRAVRAAAGRQSIVQASRADRRLDLLTLTDGLELSLGLFRAQDVRAALRRGSGSQASVRQIGLRATAVAGEFRVMEDVFNPQRGYFVTAEYDEAVWRRERLESLALVRIGSLIDVAGELVLSPVLYPGARVDFQATGEPFEGQLHLGFVTIDGDDVFAGLA
ncbi:hypothetical protein BH10ACT3_BH10ACT3_05700 [soil metagenome]